MRIGFSGELLDERVVRVGFIGCGSHAFRNVYPALQFAPVRLEAVCDLKIEKARAFAAQFGAGRVYDSHEAMLADGGLDAVLVVTNYDEHLRPRYPELAVACMQAGCHVWMEKPPAATRAEIEAMQAVARETGRVAMVGFKKMFMPANEKARELMDLADFGRPRLVLAEYPQHLPSAEEFERYLVGREPVGAVMGFLDHLCHPASVVVYLLGMPRTLYYERGAGAAGAATMTFASGAVCTLHMTGGAPWMGGGERTVIVGDGRRIVVENNVRVYYHKDPPQKPGEGYGRTPSAFGGEPEQATAFWEPEFSLGQLYNKGLFLLGYWGEIDEFARAILEGRQPCKCTLEHAWQITRLFEAFAEGPGKVIELEDGPWEPPARTRHV